MSEYVDRLVAELESQGIKAPEPESQVQAPVVSARFKEIEKKLNFLL